MSGATDVRRVETLCAEPDGFVLCSYASQGFLVFRVSGHAHGKDYACERTIGVEDLAGADLGVLQRAVRADLAARLARRLAEVAACS